MEYEISYERSREVASQFRPSLDGYTIHGILSRICEAPRVNDSSSLPSTFKKWLPSRETINDLHIVDDADNPEAVLVSNYVPSTSWGDIAYTSLD